MAAPLPIGKSLPASGKWLVAVLLALVLLTGSAVRIQRLHNSPPNKLLADVRTYIAGALRVSLSTPCGGHYTTGPMVLWVDRAAIEAGSLFGLGPKQAVKYGTSLLSLGTLCFFFLWARALAGSWGAFAAAMFAALNPLLAEMDISGGRDTPFMFWLNCFCFFAFAVKGQRAKWLGMGLAGGMLGLTRINSLLLVIVISGLSLWRAAGKGFWRPWLGAVLIAMILASPFVAAQWIIKGDPLYSINSHAAWHSRIDPDSGRDVHSFSELLFKEIGMKRLVVRTVDGAYRWLFGPEARASFFSAQSLPYGLYLAPFVMYVFGMGLAVLRVYWQPFLVLLLVAGPVWPLSQAKYGLDPRLLLFTVFFIAFCIGVCGAWFLQKLPLPPFFKSSAPISGPE